MFFDNGSGCAGAPPKSQSIHDDGISISKMDSAILGSIVQLGEVTVVSGFFLLCLATTTQLCLLERFSSTPHSFLSLFLLRTVFPRPP